MTSGVEQPIASGALRRSRFFSLFPSIMLPMSLAVIDQTIVASALPAIAASLGDVERISWVVIGYLVANTIAAPVYGYVGDVLGRRRLLIGALTLFIVASVLCALAPSIPLLAAARVLQGLGGGGLMTLSQALVGQVVPPRERGNYQGYLATMATVASAIGPVIGGFLTQGFGWPWIFLINVPLGLIAILLVLRLPSGQTAPQRDWHFDFPGLLFYVAFIVPVLIALQQIEHLNPSAIWTVALLAVLSVTALVLLIRQEGRTRAPLLPLDLISQPAMWRACALASFHGAALTALVAFLPIYFRVVDGTTAAETGYLLLPVTTGLGIGSIIVGRIVTRTGRTMIFPSIGLIFATLVLVFFAFASPHLTATQISLTVSAAMFFMGTVMGVVQITAQTRAGPRLGAAAAAVQLSRAVGASFGTAIVGTILFASLAATDSEAARLFAKAIDLGPEALMQVGEAQRTIVATEIGDAFRYAFGIIAVFTTGGMILAWTNPSRRI